MPERIQLSRRKGWRMPPNTVKVDRTTKWGNPFKAGERHRGLRALPDSHAHAVGLFRKMIEQRRFHWLNFARREIVELRGKNLACWCKPGDPCHADVLLELANRPLAIVDSGNIDRSNHA